MEPLNVDFGISDFTKIPEPQIISREKWKADKPKDSNTTTKFPIKYLVLMRTNTPVCKTVKSCKKVVKLLQKKHMDEGAPDIHHNYLISTNGTVFEGRSHNMAGMKYNPDDSKLKEAENNSINIAYIDNGKEHVNVLNLQSAVTQLAAKLIKEKIINSDVDVLWFDQNKKKSKLTLSERMDKYRQENDKGDSKISESSTEPKLLKRKKKSQPEEEPPDIKEPPEDIKGPFLFGPRELVELNNTEGVGKDMENSIGYF